MDAKYSSFLTEHKIDMANSAKQMENISKRMREEVSYLNNLAESER
jgi:hypothetical protein